eukprot:CAMPEP_0114285072 /NCGR_PEP_ID=MMETSP0059-20121206/4987_1 /TAXON_ID=36894 /ORGANISM="Pyramimonas parkeae, Strain CCMP726" /LENGTH=46 /DNA_ID= /DNA_START= /DNA_END= /DNA_ORIENTATION=
MNLRGHEKRGAHKCGVLYVHNQAASPQVCNLEVCPGLEQDVGWLDI